jgi:MFS family permease
MMKQLRKISNIRTFSSLKNRVYRLYYIGMLGQWTSMNMQIVARSYLIYQVSGSGAVLGLAALANAIPTILLSLPGGALADRIPKRDILLYTQLGSMLVSLGVALSLTFGYLSADRAGSWWILIVAAAAQGTFMGFMMPSRQSIIAEIVDSEQIMNAVSLGMMGMNALRILGPAAAGFLIDATGYNVVYFISTAMYGLASFCMFLMPRTVPQHSDGSNAVTDIINGVQYIRREKTMMLVIVATLFVMICSMPFMQLMPMITEDILKVGESGMGILLSVSGLGAIVGSLTLASLPNRKRGFIMLGAGVIMGLALVVFAFSRSWPLSVFVVVFVGLGQTSHRTSGNSLVQYYVEPEYRGRVMSFMMMGVGFSSLGTFVAGLLSESLGVQWSIGGLALVLVVMSIVLATATARLRKLE